MVTGRDKGKGKKGKALPRRDVALWKTMTRDVRRLPGRDYQDDADGVDEIQQGQPSEIIRASLPNKLKNKQKERARNRAS